MSVVIYTFGKAPSPAGIAPACARTGIAPPAEASGAACRFAQAAKPATQNAARTTRNGKDTFIAMLTPPLQYSLNRRLQPPAAGGIACCHCPVLCYTYPMVVEQTVEIPASRRLTIEVPPEVPVGKIILTFTPVPELSSTARGQSKNEAFRNALRRGYGAWKEKPWENSLQDIRAMREEWGRYGHCS
jgi:hypothetical protein